MRLIDADKFKDNILSGLYVFCQENKEDIARAIDAEPTICRTDRPVCIIKDQAIYIDYGYVNAMIEYEKKERVKHIVQNMMKNFDDCRRLT